MTPNINLILTERYINKNSEDKVHEVLTALGVTIHKVRLQVFIRRVLFDLPDAQAKRLGVDAELLRAIRCRVKIGRTRQRFDCRARRRRILPVHQPKSIRSLTWPAPRGESRSVAAPVSLLSPEQKLVGTLDNPANSDWKIINGMARKKVFAIDRMVMLNHHGEVVHPRSKHRYTEAELQKQFGLTYNEAMSCFMTFT